MGTFSVPLEVGNLESSVSAMVDAVVDTGATYTMLPSSSLNKLSLGPVQQIRFRVASGEYVNYDTSWATFAAEGRNGMARVIFGPDELFLFGATTLEDLRLAVDPIEEKLVPVDGLLL